MAGAATYSRSRLPQMLLWGAGQPFAGALADRFGAAQVLGAGRSLCARPYVDGLCEQPGDPSSDGRRSRRLWTCRLFLHDRDGCIRKLLPPEWRTLAFGAGTAAGSFGQFLFSPLAVVLIDQNGWQHTLVIFALVLCLIIPLASHWHRRGIRRRQRHARARSSNR